MKKITFLLLAILPLLGFSQLRDYTFDTDDNKEGWSGAGLDLAVASPNPAGGFLFADGKGANTGFPQMRSETFAPLLAVTANQIIRVTIVAENATDQATWQFGNLDEGSTNFGNSEFTEFTMPIVTAGSGTSTFEFDVARNLDNTAGGIERFSLRAKVGGTPGLTGTLKIDRITVTLVTVVTEDSFVLNPDFENGTDPLTDWSVGGPDISLSFATGNGGGNAAQINFDQNITSASNNVLFQLIDFGQTVNPSVITGAFDAMSNNAGIQAQIAMRTLDALDNTVENLNGANENLTNTFQTFTYNQAVTQPFNKILFRIRVKGTAILGDKVAIDNVLSEFSYILGVEDNKKVAVNSFKLFPNPANNIINIKSLSSISKVNIYDISGKQIFVSNKVIDNKVNVSNLNIGLYVVRIEDVNHNVSTKKLVISR